MGAGGALGLRSPDGWPDHGHSRLASGLAFVLAIAALALAGLEAGNLLLLAAAGVLLDLAVQSHQALSQQEICQLRPDARARINTVFMTSVFLGDAIGSAASGLLDDRYGWPDATLLATALSVVGLLLWLGSQLLSSRAAVL